MLAAYDKQKSGGKQDLGYKREDSINNYMKIKILRRLLGDALMKKIKEIFQHILLQGFFI